MAKKVARIAFNILATVLIQETIFMQESAKAQESGESIQINYVKIEICGDVAGKDPSTGCIKIEKYLWGEVKNPRLIPSQRARTSGKYEPYNLVIDSRGCFPAYENAGEEGTYNLNTRISVLKEGKTTIRANAHPVVREIAEEIRKNRNTPGLIGERACQKIIDQ